MRFLAIFHIVVLSILFGCKDEDTVVLCSDEEPGFAVDPIGNCDCLLYKSINYLTGDSLVYFYGEDRIIDSARRYHFYDLWSNGYTSKIIITYSSNKNHISTSGGYSMVEGGHEIGISPHENKPFSNYSAMYDGRKVKEVVSNVSDVGPSYVRYFEYKEHSIQVTSNFNSGNWDYYYNEKGNINVVKMFTSFGKYELYLTYDDKSKPLTKYNHPFKFDEFKILQAYSQNNILSYSLWEVTEENEYLNINNESYIYFYNEYDFPLMRMSKSGEEYILEEQYYYNCE